METIQNRLMALKGWFCLSTNLSAFDNLVWILFVMGESFFTWIKYGTYHDSIAHKSNNECQEYVFNMHRKNCGLYQVYQWQSGFFTVLFFLHLWIAWQKIFGADIRSKISLLCGLAIEWPKYIQEFLFPNILILCNLSIEIFIAVGNNDYWIQLFVDFLVICCIFHLWIILDML